MTGPCRGSAICRVFVLLSLVLSPLDVRAEEGCDEPCPHGGVFDGSNCLVAEAPAGVRLFIEENQFFYLPGEDDPHCVSIAEASGARCQVGENPPAAHPFIFDDRFYYLSACVPAAQWSDTVRVVGDRWILSARAAHRRIHLTWSLAAERDLEVSSARVIYGQAGASDKRLEDLMPGRVKRQMLPWITRSSCRIGKALNRYRHEVDQPLKVPAMCRNGGLREFDGPVGEVWLHSLRTRLLYRIEIELSGRSEAETLRLGPVFLRTK